MKLDFEEKAGLAGCLGFVGVAIGIVAIKLGIIAFVLWLAFKLVMHVTGG